MLFRFQLPVYVRFPESSVFEAVNMFNKKNFVNNNLVS